MDRKEYRKKLIRDKMYALSIQRPEGWEEEYLDLSWALYYLTYPPHCYGV